jgi:hypothetical protein
MGRWANADEAGWATREGACVNTYAGGPEGHVDVEGTRLVRPDWGIGQERTFGTSGSSGTSPTGTERRRSGTAHELNRLRQLRTLSVNLAQVCAVEDIVDTLAVQIAGDCGAEMSVVYLMDPGQADVLRLATSRGLPGRDADPAVLCRDGGALIARAVRARQPQLSVVREPTGALTTVVACPLLLRGDPLGAFAYGFPGNFALDGASHEFLLGASALIALALDRAAATERALEAQQTSEYMTSVLRRIFGGEQKTLA